MMTFFLVAFHKLCEFAGLYVPSKIPAVLEVHPILYTDCIPLFNDLSIVPSYDSGSAGQDPLMFLSASQMSTLTCIDIIHI